MADPIEKLSDEELEARLNQLKAEDAQAQAVTPELPTPPNVDMSAPEAFARGTAQGLTFGFADELTAGAMAPFSEKTYPELREESRAEYGAAAKEYPKSYIGGEVFGSAAPVIGATLLTSPVAGSGGAAAGAGTLARMAPAVARLAAPTSKLGMAGIGMLNAAGRTEADIIAPEEPGERMQGAVETALGAPLGIMAGKAGEYGTKALMGGLGKLGDVGSDLMRWGGRKIMGATGKYAKTALQRKLTNEYLDVAAKEGVFNQPEMNPEAVLTAVEAMQKKGDALIDDIAEAFTKKRIPAGSKANLVKRLEVGLQGIKNRIRGANMGPEQDAYAELLNTVRRWKTGDKLSFSDLQSLKNNFKDSTVFNREAKTVIPQMYNQAYGILSDVMEEQVGKAGNKLGMRGALAKYEYGKKLHGAAKLFQDTIQDKLSKGMGRSPIEMKDLLAMGTGIARLDPSQGILTAGALKTALSKEGEAAYKVGAGIKTVEEKAKSIPFVKKILNNLPYIPEPWYSTLSAAAARGAQSLASAHFVLSQRDRNYDKLIQDMDDGGK